MTRTFRDYELRSQRQRAQQRRLQRKAAENDHSCAYLLGKVGEDGERTFEPDSKAVQFALQALTRGQ